MIELKKLLQSGIHFGHKTSFGHPKMRPYIWGAKNRIHLIDVSKTAFLLEHAGKRITELASSGKSILWIGTKKPAQTVIKKVAEELKMPFVVNRWIGGTLSNYSQVKKAITRLLHLQDIVKKSTTYYTKKEMVMLQKQIARLEKNIGGIIDLEFPPAAIVIIDAKKERSAVKEAFGMNIPVIALVDTNTDPSCVHHVIPGNDDSPKSITLVVEYLAQCAAEGKKNAEKKKTADSDSKDAKEKKKAATPKKEATSKKDAAPKKTVKKAVKKAKAAAPKTTDTSAKDTSAKDSKAADTSVKTTKKVAKKKTAAKK